jgi:CubicO group peptidase (beta-lactamase class C family)
MPMRILCRTIFVAVVLLSATLSSAQNVGDAVRAFLRENIDVEKEGAGIVVGIVDENGTTVVGRGRKADGTAEEVNGDTVFEIGSVSKTFTVLLLQDMVARGRMRLEDPVAKFLPDSVKMPAGPGGGEITLLDLATHGSGLPMNADNFDRALPATPWADYTTEKLYAFLSGHTLRREPGAAYEYSNVGSGLLGHVIALRAGKDYESLLVERICGPLGMSSTRVTLPAELQARLAKGHDASGKPAANWDIGAIVGAGGIRSSANDLLKYVSAQVGLTASELTPLMKKTHEIRWRNVPMPGHREGEGELKFLGNAAMSWMDSGIEQPPGMELLGHGGGTGGYSAFVGMDLRRRRGVVVLSNQSGGAGGLHVGGIGWVLLRGEPLSRDAVKEVFLRGKEIVGIGAALELDPQSRMLRVTKVFANSPASRGGVPAPVLVRKIDDVPTSGLSLNDCVARLRGQAGTKVRLELFDPERDRSTEVELTRNKVRL